LPPCRQRSSQGRVHLRIGRFWSRQWGGVYRLVTLNTLLKQEKLIIEADRITFYIESQGVYIWQTEILEENPKVYISENIKPQKWLLEEERLSGFIYQMLLFEAIMGADYHCMASWIDKESLESILEKWIEAPVKAWQWPSYPSIFYYTQDALAMSYPNEQGFTFQCGSNNKDALKFMDKYIDDNWEDVAIG
ncbi:MAG: hypothetical protein JW709_04645, partial [Sedimentisphaerales bacterium]|nr:hypothetical protein [Sedimentisphaerales bacterium]